MAPSSSTFTVASLTALEECSEASVYAPGSIQPHGVLLALQEPDLKVLQVSENVEQLLGLPASALLGQSLQQVFARAQVKQITHLLQQEHLERCHPFVFKTRVKDPHPQPPTQQERGAALDGTLALRAKTRVKTQTFRGTLHRTADALLLELEPESPTAKTSPVQFYERLQAAILSFRSAPSLTALAATLASEVKSITGFDRVMVYRFAADEHGVVIAEAKEDDLESYLGLHYPAIDIPVPARKLFRRNWIRQIPDVNYTPAAFMPGNDTSHEQPLDLSDCVLRGVSPFHIEYLQNMGVAGSLTISLLDDQRLWGLIACHHYSPRLVAYETRKTCECLGPLASIELVHQQERALSHDRVQVKAIQDKLQQSFLQEPELMQQVLSQHTPQLLDLVHAGGVAMVLDQDISLLGQTPSLEDVQALLRWLPASPQHDIYLTDCLARSYPPASAFKHTASGILVVSIVLQQKSYHLLWFRPEQIQTVRWAGNPQEAITVDALGNLHLCPRKSFALWQETVCETALPWQAPEIEAAQMMRNTLMLAVLEFSQAALEQAAARATIANRAKSQFLANMSHELRTPLNAILGFTQVLHHSPNTPTEFQEHLGIISRSGEHLLALINDVLEMSRIEAGQVVLTERCFNLHRLLRSLQDMFTLKAGQKGLTLALAIDESAPRHVCGDESKLRQIVTNLISNAIKFTVQGSVTVQVTAAATSRRKAGCTCYPQAPPSCQPLVLSFAVTDTGCGIDYRDWDAIFEAFMQTEQGRYAQGTGLGLSISRQFARLMQGDLTVQSTVNQGSTFTCKVLLRQLEAMTLAESEITARVVGLEPAQPTYRILVVEDARENRLLLQTLLEPIGFAVRVAENGADAIAQWQQWRPHLIFMDIQMPVMDGYESIRQIRAQEAVVSRQSVVAETTAPLATEPPHRTKIIVLTAYAFDTDRAASLQADCDDYITKPFAAAALFVSIARQLGLRYRYAEPALAETVTAEPNRLTRQALHTMPAAWLAQVHEAALVLNDAKIRQLMAHLPPQEQRLLEAMTALVENFQLEAIATLTQPDGGNHEDFTQTG